MAYTLLEQYSSTFYGGPMVPKGITIHWWGDPAQRPQFYGIVNVLLTRGQQKSASVHYVAEDGLVACLVSPTVNSWGNGDGGSGWGNLNTITIECNPRCTPGDRETVAQLIADLRKMFGNLPLFPHNRWTATQCPGVWEQHLAWLDARANQILAAGGSTKVPSQPAPAPVQPTPAKPAPSGLHNRKVTQAVAWVRTGPSANSPKVKGYEGGIAQGATLAVKGYVKGQDPFNTKDDAWYVTKSGFYVWANAAENNIAGLPYLGDKSGSVSPAPKPAPVPAKKTYVTLPASAQSWGIYRLGVQPVSANIFARLAPAKFGGLTYQVLQWTVPGQVAVIQTAQFGQVQIYVAPGTGAVISTK